MILLRYLTAFALFGFSALANASSNQEIIHHVSYNVILETYTDLANRTANLALAVNNLQVNLNQDNLDKARAAWREARQPWESSEAFLFGPVDSLGIDPMLDTWPLNKLDLDSVMNSSRPITVDLVRALGTNLQGFHTIEYLLFGDGVSSNNKSLVSFTKKQLDYLSAASVLLAEHSRELALAWAKSYDPEDPTTPGYVQVISQPSFTNAFYSSERAVMEELIQGMIGIIDEVANGKMADPMGADISSANIALVESPFSWNSLNDFTNNIGSVYSVYTGRYQNNIGPGVKDLVLKVNPELAHRVDREILKCMSMIQAIRPEAGGDFGQAIKTIEGRVKTQAAIESLNALRDLLDSEVLPTIDQ